MGQSLIPPTPEGATLAGQTIIITGGGSGLGFETARQFLTLKASRVIIAVRSTSKGQEAVAALKANPAVKAANPNAVVEAFELDLEDYESGLRFTQRIKSEVKELDILLCNGGITVIGYHPSKSSHEITMQVNCYTHFLISLELMPLLQATAVARGRPSHLTYVGSSMHTMHSMTKIPIATSQKILSHFDDKKIFSSLTRYNDSKLVVNAWVRALASRNSASGVIINNLCPGLVATGLDKNLPILLRVVMSIYRKISARKVEEGSRTLVYAAAVAGLETHGKFISSNKIDIGAPFLDQVAGKDFIEKLWMEIIVDVSKVDPELQRFA